MEKGFDYLKRILKYTFSTILIVVLLLIGGILFLLSSAGKGFVKNQIVDYLTEKLKAPIKVEKLDYDIPNSIKIEGFEVYDQQKSRLLAFKSLNIEIDMLALLDNEIKIQNIESDGLNANISKQKNYNFDFILDAFAGNPTQKSNSEPFKIAIKKINLKNTNLTFKDADSGMDLKFRNEIFETGFDSLNLDKSLYFLNDFVLRNSEISYLKLKTSTHSESEVSNFGRRQQATDFKKTESLPFVLDFITENILIDGAKIHYEDENTGIKNDLKITQFQSDLKVKNTQIDIKKAILDGFENKSQRNPQIVNSGILQSEEEKSSDWQLNLAELIVKNNQFQYDDWAVKPAKKGLDYGHLDIRRFNLNLQNLSFKKDTIKAKLNQLNFTEKSGLIVNELGASFEYSPKQINLQNFIFKTPNSNLKNDLTLRFTSIDDFSKNLEKVQILYSAKHNSLAINDILLLAPQLADNPQIQPLKNQVFNFSTSIKGFVNDLTIQDFILSGVGESQVRMNGKIRGLPNVEKLNNSLNISQLNLTKKDVFKFVSDTLLPNNLELPNHFVLKGQISGGLNDLNLNAVIDSDFGTIGYEGTLKSVSNPKDLEIDGVSHFKDFDLGKLLKVKSDSIGKVTFSANVKGKGANPKTMDLSFDSDIKKAFFNRYEYNNISIIGTLKNGLAAVKSQSLDENLSYNLISKIDLNSDFPKVKMDLDLNKIDLKKLNFYDKKLIISTKIQNDITSTDPKNPLGVLNISTITLQNDSTTIKFDSISVNLANNNDLKNAKIQTQFLEANLAGNFDYSTIKDAILTVINRYFELPNLSFKTTKAPTHFSFNSFVRFHPSLNQFVPKLKKFEASIFDLKFDNQSDSPIVANSYFPSVIYDTLAIKNIELVLSSDLKVIDYKVFMDSLGYQSYQLRNSELIGNIVQNQINFNYTVRDSTDKPQHGIIGNLKEKGNDFALRINDLKLNYKDWQSDTTGFVNFGKFGVVFKEFALNDGKQKIAVNTLNHQPNAPLEIISDNIDIQQLTNAFMQDSTIAKGKINANITLVDYLTKPTFTGDLLIKNLELSSAKVGDVVAFASYEGADKITTYATLENENDNLILSGDYHMNSPQPIDYQLIIKKLSDKTIEAFSFGTIKDTKGELFGNINLKGSTDKLNYDGELLIDSLGFQMASLGAKYLLKNQKLEFKNENLVFKNFILQDSTKSKMTLDGLVKISQLPDYQYDLKVSGKDFMAMNSTEKDNPEYFGKCFVNADLRVNGNQNKYKVEGGVRINENSFVTTLLSDAVEKEEAEGVVRFVDLSKNLGQIQTNNSKKTESTSNQSLGSELSLNIETDEKAEFKVVVDPLNGDFLQVKGKAFLNTSMNSSGQMTLTGVYEIEDGGYDFSYQILKKPFKIQKGSKITWTGDPMKGEIDITAYYPVKTSALELIDKVGLDENLKKDARRKFDFRVLMKMKNNLSAPQLTFDIDTPENTFQSLQQTNLSDEIDKELKALRENDINMNRQVFGLLVLGKFLNTDNSNLLDISAESKARESLSKMLSEQLDNFAKDIIKGVNLDLNLNSAGQTGLDASTNLNVGLSKEFLNDRLTVSVGRNFELENNTNVQRNNEVFDNYALNFKITKDGRFAVRGYRMNQLQSIIEGYVVETGVSFTIVLEF